MHKLFRGTTQREAQELSKDIQTRLLTHWTDSYEKASMYSKGAVIELLFDDLPPNVDHYSSCCVGDVKHGSFKQWVIPRAYFEKTMSCFVEEHSLKIT